MIRLAASRLVNLQTTLITFMWVMLSLIPYKVEAAPPSQVLSFTQGALITLTWTPPTDIEVIGYSIYRGSDQYSLTKIATVGAASPSEANNTPPPTKYNDYSISPGGTYFYRLKAIDTTGVEGEFSPFTAATAYQLTTTSHSDGYASRATVGDYNGDGLPDLALGFPWAVVKSKTVGKVTIYFGSKTTKQTIVNLIGDASNTSLFGTGLTTADMNKDGIDDLFVGAPNFGEGGRVYIYSGSSKFSTIPTQIIDGIKVYSSQGVYLTGEHLGETICPVGDTNGDGFTDIAISAPAGGFDRSGAIYILYGSNPIGINRAKIQGERLQDYFGTAVVPAGDNTGDGLFDTWASISPKEYSPRGENPLIYLINGGDPPILDRQRLYPGGPAFTATDFDGDGYSDPVVVAAGGMAVYSGAPTSPITPFVTFGLASTRIFPAGDVDGDGKGDVISDGARIYFGNSGLPITPYIGTSNNYSIIGIADVNGDGTREAILSDNTPRNEKVYLVSVSPFQGLPKILINPGIDGSITDLSTVTISGKVTDSPNFTLVGGVETPLTPDGSFTTDVALKNGKNIIEIIAKSSNGKTVKRYLVVNYLTSELALSITSPINGAVLTTNPVTIEGTVSEQNSLVTVNGTPATVSGNSWNASLTLTDGLQSIIAAATDSYKRTANTSVAINFGTTVQFGNIGGTITDNYGIPLSVATVTITDTSNKSRTATSDYQGRYSLLEVPAGTFSAQFTKEGFIGKSILGSLTANESIDLSVKLQRAPELHLAVSSPLPGSVFHLSTASVTGTVNNDATVMVNGMRTDVVDGNFSTLTTLTEGSSQIIVTAQDQYGQKSTVSVPVIYTPGPLLTDITYAAASASSLRVAWHTDQPATGIIEYGTTNEYGSKATQSSSNLDQSILISGLTPGATYHLKITATNSNGFSTSSEDVTVTLPIFSSRFMEDIGNVCVIEIEGNYDAKNSDGDFNSPPRQQVAQEYFKNHPDKDFLVFFSTFDYPMPTAAAQGFYLPVKNDTQGINRDIFNNSALFGSGGILQGTIDMGSIKTLAYDLNSSRLNETLDILNHEIGHRWLTAVRFKLPDGTLNSDLLGIDNAHWSYLFNSKNSLMYGNDWRDNKDGTFTSVSTGNAFSPLDLYLMGMIPKEQIPPMLLIENPAIDRNQLRQLGATISGTAKYITINDIISAEGERIPDFTSSQKRFNIGYILLTRPGDTLTVEAQAIETVRTAFAGKFGELTRGIGGVEGVTPTLNLTIDSPTNGSAVIGPDTVVHGSFINSTGAETGITVNGLPATVVGNRFIVNRVPLQPGDNTITATAVEANGLTTTTTRIVTAQAGNYIRIQPNIESGTAPLELFMRVDGSFTPINSKIVVQGPGTITVEASDQPNEYTAKLILEGSYTVTASAQGPDGQIYTDYITVTVLSKSHIESILQWKWSNMKERIAAGDISGALTSFANSTQAKYNEFFTDLGSQFPFLNNYLNDIGLVYSINDFAKCRLFKDKTIMGAVHKVEYIVYFAKENGTWKIIQF